jgi:hypothetical protein
MKTTLLIVLGCLCSATASAQTADTTKPTPAPVPIVDTSKVKDTTIVKDTLSAAQKAALQFEERYRQFKKVEEERKTRFSFFDTLATYFASPRLNQRELLERSYNHGAGDYFRFDPSYVVSDYAETPLRETVAPFGLNGDRMNVLINGNPEHPFEHVVEPDGMFDMYDIPTGLDHDVYILPGAMGTIFGGSQSLATLLTRPYYDTTFDVHSAFLVDKGWNGFSNARGKYSKQFVSGRRIDMTILYRLADGSPFYASDDNCYQYDGDFYFPVGRNGGISAVGRLYNRTGSYIVRPDSAGLPADRNRFDRSFSLSWQKQDSSHTSMTEYGYKHLRQSSDLDPTSRGDSYRSRLNNTGHGLFVSREWQKGNRLFKTEFEGNRVEFDDGVGNWHRYSGGVTLTSAVLKGDQRFAWRVNSRYVEGIKLLPSASVVWVRETERSYVATSIGYSEREPSMLEIHMPYQRTSLYGPGAFYADSGNSDLKAEKQLVGSAIVELGARDQALSLSVTGGRIFDGIDWTNALAVDTGGIMTLFTPVNGNINFATATVRKSVRLHNFLRFNGGGSYHYLDYTAIKDKAYSPKYQLFSGMELHLFWAQKLIHLYAYGEVSYIGPYHGYQGKSLGEAAVVNTKLSFQMARFRFYYLIQNAFARFYSVREDFERQGRSFHMGSPGIFSIRSILTVSKGGALLSTLCNRHLHETRRMHW